MMKKIIVMVMLSGLIYGHVNAQDASSDKRGKPQIGLKIGGNYSNVYDTEGEEFKSDAIFGLAAGATLVIPVTKIIGLQPEILLSQRGFKATGRLFGTTYDMTRTTTYLDIPLMVTIKPLENITLMAGPQYSYMLKVSNKFENASTTILQEQEFDNDNLRKNILAFTLGGDINIDHLVIGARIGWDLTNNNGDGTSTTPRYKNTWTQVTLGYLFF